MFKKQFIYENDHAIITIQNCLLMYKIYLILVKKKIVQRTMASSILLSCITKFIMFNHLRI